MNNNKKSVQSAIKNKTTKYLESNIAPALDIQNIMKASTSLSKELVLSKWLIKMTNIIIKNISAQKCFIILPKKDNWLIKAQTNINNANNTVLKSLPLKTNKQVSIDIISYVIRTHKNVILHNATKSVNFPHDVYIIKNCIKSVLCMPLVNQDRIIAILYLENNLINHAFHKDQVQFLSLLSKQAAITLENTMIFKDLNTEYNYTTNIIRNSSSMICGIDINGITTFINPIIEKVTGYKAKELIHKNWWRLLYPEKEYKQVLKLFKGFEKNEVVNYEMTLTCKNGDKKTILWNSFTKKDDNNNAFEIIGIGKDITERKKVELAFIKNERKYQEIFNASNDTIFIQNAKTGEILDVNKSAVTMYGFQKPELIGLKIDFLSSKTPPFDSKNFLKLLKKARNKGPQIFEWQAKKKNGELFWVEINLKYSHIGEQDKIMAVIRDITQRKKSQEILMQNEKMLSVGGLAAGMAHEINNPLSGMIHNADVMTKRLLNANLPANQIAANKAGTSMESILTFMKNRNIIDMLSMIRESGIQASKIVSNMLSFSRQNNTSFSFYKLDELLDKIIVLAYSDYNLKKKYDFHQIKITRAYEKELPLVPCDSSRIQQVLFNILRNAAEAMSEQKHVCKKHHLILRLIHEKKAKWIRIEIENNGPGMDESTRKRVFEPFFTTKPPDQGTGLGLYVSYFIITENHGGEISVQSTTKGKTNFIIRLPLIKKS